MADFTLLRFGELAPDQPDFGSGTMRVARNCIPRLQGYQPLQEILSYSSNGLDGPALGAFALKDRNGNSFNFAGDSSKLYQLTGLSWADATRVSGGSYNADRWEFARLGETVYACARSDLLQSIALGAANFADVTLTGGPIQARHIAVVRQVFLMVGNVNDQTEGLVPHRVRWTTDPSDWTPNLVIQSGQQDLTGSGGEITRIVEGETPLIFQERAVWRASYVGGDLIWQFDEVEPFIGTRAPGSVVRHGYSTYFLAEDGFRVFRGASSAPIGEERIDRTVLANIDTAYLHKVTSAISTDESVIYWAYPDSSAINGRPNQMVIFNADVNRWTSGQEAVDILYRASTSLVDVDDPALNATYTDVDVMPQNIDDPAWAGGNFELGALCHDGSLGFFSGVARTAELETQEQQHRVGRRSFINGVRPVVDGGSTEIAIAHRNRQSDTPNVTAYIPPSPAGKVPHRVNARYVRYLARISGDWRYAVGVVPQGRVAGVR